ncbi:putative oxidoreductase isoform x3 [Lasius niger]|uniref:Putative oxidoreductase isoform x3 n=1 Tax=Lasius niger TaxID=67767 RepID=A0A0J7K2H5_LASNI|nr:putative oxidoreductase isoform x3 [Lasius niger]
MEFSYEVAINRVLTHYRHFFLINIDLALIVRKMTYTLLFLSDLTNTDGYKRIVDTVSEKVNGAGLNLLFNNAGISSKFTRLGLVKEQQIIDAFLVNTVAPIMLTKVCL